MNVCIAADLFALVSFFVLFSSGFMENRVIIFIFKNILFH